MLYRVTYRIGLEHHTEGFIMEGHPRSVVIEAPTTLDVFCVAFDYLTRQGYDVRQSHVMALKPDDLYKAVHERGVPNSVMERASPGCVTISAIEPYNITMEGYVVAPTIEVPNGQEEADENDVILVPTGNQSGE